MRIPGNVYNNNPIATRTGQADRAAQTEADDKKADGASVAAGAKNITVDVSSRAKALATDNALDVAKVDRLRAAIAGGAFNIDHHAIAASLIETGG